MCFGVFVELFVLWQEQGRRLPFTESPAAFNNEYFREAQETGQADLHLPSVSDACSSSPAACVWEVLLWEQRQKMPKPKTRYKDELWKVDWVSCESATSRDCAELFSPCMFLTSACLLLFHCPGIRQPLIPTYRRLTHSTA